MNPELIKAMEAADAAAAEAASDSEGVAQWHTIKQALRDLDAENARLRKIEEERWSVVATRNAAVMRAEKADALLRHVSRYIEPWKFPDARKAIEAHLQGAGDE